jgi:hypothetical protein
MNLANYKANIYISNYITAIYTSPSVGFKSFKGLDRLKNWKHIMYIWPSIVQMRPGNLIWPYGGYNSQQILPKWPLLTQTLPRNITTKMQMLWQKCFNLNIKNNFYEIVFPNVFLIILIFWFVMTTKVRVGKSILASLVEHGPYILYDYMMAISILQT